MNVRRQLFQFLRISNNMMCLYELLRNAMRNWEESCKEAGAVLATESVICNDMPDDDGVENCKALGAALA